jgi:hypothetical protein
VDNFVDKVRKTRFSLCRRPLPWTAKLLSKKYIFLQNQSLTIFYFHFQKYWKRAEQFPKIVNKYDFDAARKRGKGSRKPRLEARGFTQTTFRRVAGG